MSRDVPVLMFHSVGPINDDWIWNFLTIPLDPFVDQMKAIHRDFTSLHLSELAEVISRGNSPPENSVVLTFDDGYLDNWVYAFPVLKKYGIKATIFVTPEFVDREGGLRPNLDEVWRGEREESELDGVGFLSWEEMREMERTGLVEIQSHAMSHTWYFSDNKIIDFRHPGDEYIWMDWNDAPAEKYRYLSGAWQRTVRYGEPVYGYQKSLEGRRIFPCPGLGDELVAYVVEKGETSFFENEGWREELFEVASRLAGESGVEYELEDAKSFEARLEYEIGESKRVIERNLDKQVDLLCWPGGGICPQAIDVARKHYKAVTLPSSLSSTEGLGLGDDQSPLFIKRIGPPLVEQGGDCRYLNGDYLYHQLKEYGGSRLHRKWRQLLKVKELIKLRFERVIA